MNWKTINVDSSFRREGDNEEPLGFDLKDEKGASLIQENEDVTIKEEAEDFTTEDKVVEPEAKEETEEKKPQHKSRAQERIRELVAQKKELEAKYEAELETARKKLSEMGKSSLSTQKEFIDARIAETKKAMTKAQEEGKFDEASEYISQLADLQTKKIVVESTPVEQAQEKPKTTTQNKEFDDTEIQIWAVKNREWWQKDPVKTQLAVSLSKKIDKEGELTPDTPEYFAELDERIREMWGEADMEKDLQSSGKDEAKETKKPPQTTSGVSRTPSVKSKKPVISLNKAEQEMARKLGISNLDWAKQKYRQLKNTDENGYQVLLDN